MQKILLAQATAGMILARDVVTAEGRVLCGKGTELSDSLLSRLGRMEITALTVKGHPVVESGEKSLEEEIVAIKHRFSKVTNIPPLKYIEQRLINKLVASREQLSNKTTAATPNKAISQGSEADSQ